MRTGVEGEQFNTLMALNINCFTAQITRRQCLMDMYWSTAY